MSEPAVPKPPPDNPEDKLKIYFLPNLLTAGNLFCGFVALTKIVEADPSAGNYDSQIYLALIFILFACVCDLFDGRVARWGGADSPFGREFDSLADLISFGAAPAFLVHRIVLRDVWPEHPEIGWFIASIYLICGAFRLARFNVLSLQPGGSGREFVGFPIPSAAALVASLTLFMMWVEEKEFVRGKWRFLLPVLMLFLSLMMVSHVRYPSFKALDLRASRTFTKTLVGILFVGCVVVMREKILVFLLPLFFTAYLIYGFVRPSISRAWRREIEEDDEDEPDAAP
jgi:CDP-diacylglycerol---serine O-phosphatidyltransferase